MNAAGTAAGLSRVEPGVELATRDDEVRARAERVVMWTLVGLFAIVLVRTAWLCDDAYINFRTIDNVLHGYGLRWNVAERVQTFTDPLWVLLVTAAVAVTREFYFTTIALSLVLSFAAVVLYATRAAPDSRTAVAGVLMLVCSKAFVDYSTGGLENPLAHLLIVVFLVLYERTREPDRRHVFRLAAVLTLCALTRMDIALLVAPTLVVVAATYGWRKSFLPVLAGAVPLVAWELFSIVYYGQPLPNTAYAKVGGGVPPFERLEQGLYYLLDSVNRDPLTLTVIAAAMAVPFVMRGTRDRPVALGIALSVAYAASVGGDFMSGRFLAAPFLCAVIVLTHVPWGRPAYLWVFPLAIVFVGAASSQALPIGTDRTFHHDFQDFSSTVDERRVYYQYTGLLNAGGGGPAEHPWARHAREVIASGERVTIYIANGFFGFTLGPRVHVVDPMALGDMLLAHLPVAPNWRPGHFERRLPDGYIETLRSGQNRIVEPTLGELYEHVHLIVSGPLFSRARLRAIWKLNTGGYDRLIDGTSYGVERVTLDQLAAPLPEGTPLHSEGVRRISESGIEINAGLNITSGRIDMSADGNDDYLIVYGRGALNACHQLVRAKWPHTDGRLGLAVYVVDPPACAASYDRLRIYGRHGFGAYFVGHVRIVP